MTNFVSNSVNYYFFRGQLNSKLFYSNMLLEMRILTLVTSGLHISRILYVLQAFIQMPAESVARRNVGSPQGT